MKKFVTPIVIILVIISGCWLIRVANHNINQYAYYYASHMKHGKYDYPAINMTNYFKFNPKLVSGYEIIDNEQQRKSNSYRTRFIKRNVITKGDVVSIQYTGDNIQYYRSWEKYMTPDNKDTDELSSYNNWENVQPLFNKKLTHHQVVLYQVLDDFEGQIKKNSTHPKINLQWLFNLKYRYWWKS